MVCGWAGKVLTAAGQLLGRCLTTRDDARSRGDEIYDKIMARTDELIHPTICVAGLVVCALAGPGPWITAAATVLVLLATLDLWLRPVIGICMWISTNIVSFVIAVPLVVGNLLVFLVRDLVSLPERAVAASCALATAEGNCSPAGITEAAGGDSDQQSEVRSRHKPRKTKRSSLHD